MSTPLKSIKSILELSRTTVSRAMEGTENSKIYSEFLTNTGIMSIEGNDKSAFEMEKELFSLITSSNMESFEFAYLEEYQSGKNPNTDPEEGNIYQEQLDGHKKKVEEILENDFLRISKTDNFIVKDNYQTLPYLLAEIKDIDHGIDKEGKLKSALASLQKSVAMSALKTNPMYKAASIENQAEVARSILSMQTYGDSILDMYNGMRTVIARLEKTGIDHFNGGKKPLYADNVLSSYLDCMYEGNYKDILFENRDTPSETKSISQKTGLVLRIQSDIPEVKESDSYVVAKTFENLKKMVNTDVWAQDFKKSNPLVTEDIISEIRSEISSINDDYADIMVRNMKSYQIYYDSHKTYDSENSM